MLLGHRASHFHGHACHHISPGGGCPNCGEPYCYRCLQSGKENVRLRGSQGACICGGWSNFCRLNDIIENLVLRPYPHDMRCGCPICPECRLGSPCPTCYGNCAVCSGIVHPGPAEMSDVDGWVAQTPELIQLAAAGNYQRGRHDEYVHGGMPLHVASSRGDVAGITRELVERRVDVNILDGNERTALSWACERRQWEVARLLVEVYGADVNIGRSSPLYWACWAGHLDITLLLIGHQAEIDRDMRGIPVRDDDYHDVRQSTALHAACAQGHIDIVRLLVEMYRGFDCNRLDVCRQRGEISDNTILGRACDSGHLDVVQFLLEAYPGLDINCRVAYGETALSLACAKGHGHIARLLIAREEVNINLANNRGWPPLYHACVSGEIETVRLLLGRSASIYFTRPSNAKRGTNHSYGGSRSPNNVDNALHAACMSLNLDLVRMFVDDYNISIDTVDSSGELPLFIAHERDSNEHDHLTSRFLVQRHWAIQQNSKVFPLHLACERGMLGLVQVLLEDENADVNLRDKKGESALHSVVRTARDNGNRRHMDILRLLLDQQRLNVNQGDHSGLTALHLACVKSPTEMVERRYGGIYLSPVESVSRWRMDLARLLLDIVRLLLDQQRLNVNQGDHSGITALHLVCTNGWTEVVELLVETRGADINVVSGEGLTPLKLACMYQHSSIIRYLIEHKADVNLTGKARFETPLYCAYARDYGCSISMDNIRLLLDNGARVRFCMLFGVYWKVRESDDLEREYDYLRPEKNRTRNQHLKGQRCALFCLILWHWLKAYCVFVLALTILLLILATFLGNL
jgi:ankyrin repeat protein